MKKNKCKGSDIGLQEVADSDLGNGGTEESALVYSCLPSGSWIFEEYILLVTNSKWQSWASIKIKFLGQHKAHFLVLRTKV